VASWADQTGNASNLLVASGTPTYSATGFGSPTARPAIQTSSGTPDNYLSASGATIAQGDSMILVVQSSVASPTSNQNFISGPSGMSQAVGQISGGDTSLLVNASAVGPQTVAASNLTQASILQVDFNGASTFAYQNGTVLGAAISPGAESLQFANLGIGPVGGNPFTGNFAEVLLFEPLLSAQWRTVVTRYLGARYGITVP